MGNSGEQAGLYAQIVVVAYYAQFVVVPVSRALLILEHQTSQLVWDATRALLTAGAVCACALLNLDLVWCVVSLAGTQLLSYIVLFFLVLEAARSRNRIGRR